MFVIIIDSCVMCANHETDPTEEEFTVIGFQSLSLSQALISNNTNMTAEPCPLFPVSNHHHHHHQQQQQQQQVYNVD